MNRFLQAIPYVALATASLGCFGLTKKARPDDPTAAEALGADAAQCEDGKVQEYMTPLVVDMASADRGDFEIAMKEGVVAVKHDCKTMTLLPDCSVEGSYGFMGFQRKEEVIRLDDKDEVSANLPINGGAIGAKLGGEFEKQATLDIALMMVGKRRTTRKAIKRGDLVEGRPGACEGATHFVRGSTIGAFAMATGTKAESRGAAEIFGIPKLGKVGVSGGSTSSKDVSTKDGELASCEKADPDGDSPPSGCGAILRLELTIIDEGPRTDPPAGENMSIAALCGEGLVYSEGKCTQPAADKAHLCKPGDYDDCEKQCEAGDPGSCGRVGYYHVIGEHFPKDAKKGAEYFEKACDKDYSVGCASLGGLYLEGEGVSKDAKKGAALVEKACNMGDARFCAFLGKIYWVGNGVPEDKAKAGRFAKLGCYGGAADGCFVVAEVYRKGIGSIPKDGKRARKTYRMGCDGGDAMACYGYAVALDEGIGGKKSPKGAQKVFKALCDAGMKESCKEMK